jgi:hypothetical protein
MSNEGRYSTPAAFRRAVDDRLKARASQPGSRPLSELRREFIGQVEHRELERRIFGQVAARQLRLALR